MKKITFLIIIVTLFSCLEDRKEDIQLKFNRFDKALFSITSDSVSIQIQALEDNFGTFNQIFETEIMRKGEANDSIYLHEILSFVNHPDMREAYDSLALIYEESSEEFQYLEHELNSAFTIFREDFPSYHIPEITTFFSGFNYGVVTYDNNIAIALESFLGFNSKFYKLLGDPQYLRFHKQFRFISSNVIEVLLNEYFEKYIKDRDLLSQMIYKGKVMYCMDRMLPKKPLHEKFRFTKNEMQWVIDNELKIWTYFIENDLLYSLNERETRSFLNLSPFSKGMPNEAPSRVAYFIGYKIINKFMNRTKTPILEMMRLNESREILKISRYKPIK